MNIPGPMKEILMGAFVVVLVLIVHEMDYQDQVNAPTEEDYAAMRCEYFPGDPDCFSPIAEPGTEPKLAAMTNSEVN